MFSLKYKNIIKKALFEVSNEEMEKLIKVNSENKSEILHRFSECDSNYTFWIKDIESLITEIYYIKNNYLDENPTKLTFNFMKIRLDDTKSTVEIDKTAKTETINLNIDDDTPIKEKISKIFGTTPVSFETAKNVIKDILSNVLTDKRKMRSYSKKVLMKDENLDEDNEIISFKENRLKVFDKDNFNIDETDESNLKGTGSDMKSLTGKTILLDPRNLIGDGSYRPLNSAKIKAERSILDYEKKISSENKSKIATPEEVSSVIVYKALECVLTNPCGSFNITKNDLFSNKELNFDKDLLNYNEIEEAAFNKFSRNSYGSKILNIISVNPPEVLSPLAFASMNIPDANWSVDENGISSKKLVQQLFNKNDNMKNALVSYPQLRNQMLYDSVLLIPFGKNYKRINISTKGGASGSGAAASLAGVFQYVLNTDYQSENSNDIKKYGELIYKDNIKKEDLISNLDNFISAYCSEIISDKNIISCFNKELKLLVLLGSTSSEQHNAICKTAFNKTSKEVISMINSDKSFDKFIMTILDRQKYDFAQVNVKPYIHGDTFRYDYSVQYPAKFTGSVKLEYDHNTGGIKFHILGN